MFLTTMELTSVDGGGGTAAPNPDIGGSWDPRRYEHIYTTRRAGCWSCVRTSEIWQLRNITYSRSSDLTPTRAPL